MRYKKPKNTEILTNPELEGFNTEDKVFFTSKLLPCDSELVRTARTQTGAELASCGNGGKGDSLSPTGWLQKNQTFLIIDWECKNQDWDPGGKQLWVPKIFLSAYTEIDPTQAITLDGSTGR